MRPLGSFCLAIVVVVLVGCTRERPGSDVGHFDLVCDSADTDQSSTMFCMRVDTRDGDIRYVDLAKLPQSNGPTKTTAATSGTYKIVCDSTDTATKSDVRCLRLNRQTGEMLLVNLPKLARTPE